jgi:hypothetical protein
MAESAVRLSRARWLFIMHVLPAERYACVLGIALVLVQLLMLLYVDKADKL